MNSRTRKFLSYYKPYLGLLYADLACAFIVSAITLILPLCIRYITINVLQQEMPDALNRIYAMGALMVVLVIVHTFCNMFISYQGHLMGAKMESDMRSELFDHLQKLSFRFYDEQKTGQLMTRTTNDILSLTELYHHGPEDIVISALKFAGAFAILIHIDVKLTLIVFLFLPVMAVYAFYFNKKMNVALRESKDRIGDINAQVEDTLSGIRVVKSFTNEHIEKMKFAYANDRFVQSRGAGYKSETLFHEGLIAFTQLITIAVIVFGGAAMVHASLDLADLLTFFLCIGILIEPIQRLVNFARLYQEGITGFDRFMDILEVEPEIKDSDDAFELTRVRGEVEFRNVSFKYKEDHDEVLKNVSLHIQAGEYVAFVGPSGVGKTTLCFLVPRFYEANEGEILLDGNNIKDISLYALRRNIGIVQQDVYLFAGSVLDNIRYGNMDASQEEIIEAAKKANAHDFIMELPNGYDTDIGQRGVKLSGGQQQRLSIARVFLKNPPILILDEATSSLDNESEKAIQASLEKLTDNRTTLVIAHRLSTVRNAQRIVVLSDKGIEEQGTHEELIASDGTYAKLYNMQLKL
ncbi:ABC transporter ATP-binding protein [Paenibacillus allorhizosphaerae]|uniref:Multidrug export ATP-binding/permease protein n=1 Tax=Paenibacillus allorhizosphaerae TaxID=2849866 RepID=A0ABN7TW69_9BACL|nr:ABC transporter ATP-binding protein [Paenibacillus allorhizosphaerae]CAG7654809.1 Putative multidrug export ATP-binding/permease protein [Paenibacillus allorhizosphaerae]